MPCGVRLLMRSGQASPLRRKEARVRKRPRTRTPIRYKTMASLPATSKKTIRNARGVEPASPPGQSPAGYWPAIAWAHRLIRASASPVDMGVAPRQAWRAGSRRTRCGRLCDRGGPARHAHRRGHGHDGAPHCGHLPGLLPVGCDPSQQLGKHAGYADGGGLVGWKNRAG